MKPLRQILALLLLAAATAQAQDLYVTDYLGNQVLKVTPGGVVTTFGSSIGRPIGLAFSIGGDLFVGSQTSSSNSKITPAGVVTLFASPAGYTGRGLALDAAGRLYSANENSNTISMITPGGVVTTFATGLNSPGGLAFDATGILYVASRNNNDIVKVSLGGVVTSFVSGGGLNFVEQLNFDASGNLYAANEGSTTILKITPAAVISVFATSGASAAEGVAVNPLTGSIYTSDFDGTIRTFAPNGTQLSTLTTASAVNTTASIAFALVPEPGSAGLLLAGSLVLGLRRRRA